MTATLPPLDFPPPVVTRRYFPTPEPLAVIPSPLDFTPPAVTRFAPPRERNAAARDHASREVAQVVREKDGQRALRDALAKVHDPYGAEAVRIYEEKMLKAEPQTVSDYFDLGAADHLLVWLVKAGFKIVRI